MPAKLNLFKLAPALWLTVAAGCSPATPPPAPEPDPLHYTPAGCGYTTSFAPERGLDYSFDRDELGADPAPRRVRLGLAGSLHPNSPAWPDASSTVAIAWDTDVATLASRLRYGTSPEQLNREASGVSYRLTGTWPQRVHQVHLCGLQAATTYYYQVGGGPGPQQAWSQTYSFTTLPPRGSSAKVSIGVAGDSRDSTELIWPLVQRRYAELDVTMQLFSGDSVALATFDVAKHYANWFDKVAEAGILGTRLFLPIGGNHEKMTLSWLSNMPAPGSGATMGLYYSLQAGGAHVVLLDDQPLSYELNDPPNVRAEMLAWLDEDLTAANARREQVPFIVVVHHRGELSTSEHMNDVDVISSRNLLMPLWDKHRVDLVLNGHDHNYERSKPVRGTYEALSVQSEPSQGTTYIVCAGAGATGYAPGTAPVDYRATSTGFDSGPYAGVYGLLELEGRSLRWRAWGLNKNSPQQSGDTEIDQFSLDK
jgi:hypothetical protein